ncbi:AAA family ATPase [Lyngbya confervoides]|uniref:MoxR family ATPase n=1 Tax=Lyngbya confervoides BDU141951 TaxID=1574623 RepID=A0ABD4T5C9_9CYAN|nr:MoxR family ATPase [Lyngbya confervoides]MCM1983623.1 MoxR family ATPase [Lyngbya confervoides BDU141951]
MESLLSTAQNGAELYHRLFENIQAVIKGQGAAIRKLLAAFLGGGHVLLEDYPGTGKTTLAKALAYSVEMTYSRIQFTPDLLPTDILGGTVLHPHRQTVEFRPGPLFAHLVLADEINRASPRTQSALLEAMAEQQVTLDGQVQSLPAPFFVIATQNPVEAQGTYPLPEAQMDRFALQFQLGFVPPLEEVEILSQQLQGHPVAAVRPCLSLAEVLALRAQVHQVRLSRELKRYIVDLVQATRQRPEIQLGASPRGAIALMKVSQALALFDGYGFVTPDHVQEMAVAVLAHRLVLKPEFECLDPGHCIRQILQHMPVPA